MTATAKFITIEGGDGSGKTTLCKKIKKICGYNSSYSYYGIGKSYWSSKIIKKTFQYFKNCNFNTVANLILIDLIALHYCRDLSHKCNYLIEDLL